MSKLTIFCFYDGNTGPSLLQESMVKNVEALFKRKVDFIRVNINNNEELVKKYDIREIPSIVIEKNGRAVEKFNGLTQELFLRRAIEKFLKEI